MAVFRGNPTSMSVLRGRDVLSREVVFRDITLGVPVDVLLDSTLRRVLGLDVRCGDGVHRFLPLAACALDGGPIEVESALVLMERMFYRERALSLAALRERATRLGRRGSDPLVDVAFRADGAVAAYVVRGDDGEAEISVHDAAALSTDLLRPAV